MEPIDFAMLVLRVGIGLVILAHGVNHARSLDGTASWFESVGFKNAGLQASMSALVEIGVGILLVIGLLTPLASAGLVATMFVAFWAIHRHNGFFIFRPGEGWEYVSTLALAGLAVGIAGAGRASVDHALGLADDLNGWIGFLIVVAGVAAAGGQLAMFWRKPVATLSG
ncbi:MAG: DoxX family protein [Acidimicrobiia bacterium]|nr:DoxX family protein [Acidimicrobiia bacterium]